MEHVAHEGYAKACVVAYWRLLPKKQQHDFHKGTVAGAHVPEEHWGHTVLVEPLPAAGFLETKRYLGARDLYNKFEGRADAHSNANGWGFALLQMLGDPAL